MHIEQSYHRLKVLHLEMPRGLSLSIKPWRQDLFQRLNQAGIDYLQRDLNPDFWRYHLKDDQSGIFEHLLNFRYQSASLNALTIQRATEIIHQYQTDDIYPSLSGFSFSSDVVSDSTKVFQWTQSKSAQLWLFIWINQFASIFSQVNVVSFSVGSPDELVIAGLISEYLRQVHPSIHSILTYHRWENFSLAPRLKKLIIDGDLLKIFDSVALREDRAGECLVGLCEVLSRQDLTALQFIGTRIDEQPVLIGASPVDTPMVPITPPERAESRAIADYLGALKLRPDRILMLESLVRNDCHYGRCTFCVQNIGYPTHQQYKYTSELDRSFALIQHLAHSHGVSSFSFLDQALASSMAKRVATRILTHNLAIDWCCRMLPEQADMEVDVLKLLMSAGCREILIGLESTSPDTLAKMVKHQFDESRAFTWLDRCAKVGIDITLSAMSQFPTESDDVFYSSTAKFLKECIKRYNNINIILNRFALFADSQIAQAPQKFNITEINPTEGDLTWILDFVDGHGRSTLAEPSSLCIGLDLGSAETQYLHYSSFGLLHRWQTGRWFSQDLSNSDSKEISPLFPHRDELILGSEGYLGNNLVRMLPENRLILSSRRIASSHLQDVPYLSEDLEWSLRKLAKLNPKTLWVCSRPESTDLTSHIRFNMHLQKLIYDWCLDGCLERLIFFSTQLVTATPKADEMISGKTPLAPEESYDYAKAAMEVFCGYIARKFGISVEVIRLPLLFGGYLPDEQRSKQLIYLWHDDLSRGNYWTINSDQTHFGNSWVDVEDLIKHLTTHIEPGLHIRTGKSGDFTYADLMQNWYKENQDNGQVMSLIKSKFLVENEMNLPPRDLFKYHAKLTSTLE